LRVEEERHNELQIPTVCEEHGTITPAVAALQGRGLLPAALVEYQMDASVLGSDGQTEKVRNEVPEGLESLWPALAPLGVVLTDVD
jgi:hypothetical protein